MSFSATILTLYPEMFPGPLGHSLAGRALKENIWSLNAINIRDFATDKHRTVDDTPYGGGAGMVLKPDVVHAAILYAKGKNPAARLVYFTPRGQVFAQKLAESLITTPLILLCGHFEGIDERVIEAHKPLEISLGDYVLSGGEMAAFTVLDACVRLLPGVIGAKDSLEEESFGLSGLLEYPHYTRPPEWEGRKVPDLLLSGDHAKIRAWRQEQAIKTTRARRPDLFPLPKKTAE